MRSFNCELLNSLNPDPYKGIYFLRTFLLFKKMRHYEECKIFAKVFDDNNHNKKVRSFNKIKAPLHILLLSNKSIGQDSGVLKLQFISGW